MIKQIAYIDDLYVDRLKVKSIYCTHIYKSRAKHVLDKKKSIAHNKDDMDSF